MGTSGCAVRRRAAIALAAALFLLGAPRAARGDVAWCLTPAAEQAIRPLFASGRLQAALGGERVLTGVQLADRRIAVRATDAGGQEIGVDLVLPGARTERPHGEGARFAFHLVPPDGLAADTAAALLAGAALIDGAIPAVAIVACSPPGMPEPPQQTRFPLHLSRPAALARAGVQVLVVLAALLLGWRAVRVL